MNNQLENFSFGERLRGFRERAGLEQQELANKLGVTRNTIGNWERGGTKPKRNQIVDQTQSDGTLEIELTLKPSETDDLLRAAQLLPEYDTPTASPNPPISYLSSQEQRSRNRLLDRVDEIWIKGVRKELFSGAEPIALRLEYRPGAVEHPWGLKLPRTTEADQALPAQLKITNVFDDSEGELLILGAPGAGKTALMLELARDLITRARQDEQQPVPVVFNLASWAIARLPFHKRLVAWLTRQFGDRKQGKDRLRLDEWLLSELAERYRVGKREAHARLESGDLVLLLDGLDEVRQEDRAACVAAINAFRTAYGRVRMAVCSRETDYNELVDKLKLQEALFVQPLTLQQVDDYFAHSNNQSDAVRVALQKDALLRELVGTPLMLSILVATYAGQKEVMLPTGDTIEERRAHLFATYIDRMLAYGPEVRIYGIPVEPKFKDARRVDGSMYQQRQVIDGLAWLARQRAERGEVEFEAARLKPLIWGWVGWRIAKHTLGVTRRLRDSQSSHYELVNKLLNRLVGGLLAGIGIELGVLLVGGLQVALGGRLLFEQGVWLQVGLCSGLLVGLVSLLNAWLGIAIGLELIMGLGSVLCVELLSWFGIGLGADLTPWLIAGLGVGIFGGLGSGLLSWLVEEPFGELRSGQVVGLSAILAVALFSGLGVVMGIGPGIQLVGVVGVGLSVGLFTILSLFLLFLFIERYVLWRDAALPWQTTFLDYATNRLLLRKVGSRYAFSHQLLHAHFAKLMLPSDGPFSSEVRLRRFESWERGVFLVFLSVVLISAIWHGFLLISAEGHRNQARSLAQSENFEQAAFEFNKVVDLYPSVSDAKDLDSICWFGSLAGHAAQVLDSCEGAVALAPENASFRDSRGLARALTGNEQGAIEDFTFYLEWSKKLYSGGLNISRRKQWIAELAAGRNPFDSEILAKLRKLNLLAKSPRF